ncbi:hypothetical protein ACMFMF_010962 [Clarireedia jacksonii]
MFPFRRASAYPSSRQTREIRDHDSQTYEPYDRYDDHHYNSRGRRPAYPDGSVHITPYPHHKTTRDYSPRPPKPVLKRPYVTIESPYEHSPTPSWRFRTSSRPPDRPHLPHYESYAIPDHYRSRSRSRSVSYAPRDGVVVPRHPRNKLFDYIPHIPSGPSSSSSRGRKEIVYERDDTILRSRSRERERVCEVEFVPRVRRRDTYFREKDDDGVWDWEYEDAERRGRSMERVRRKERGRSYEYLSPRGGDEQRPLEVINYTRKKETVGVFADADGYGYGDRGRRGRRRSRDEEDERVVRRYKFPGSLDKDITVRILR